VLKIVTNCSSKRPLKMPAALNVPHPYPGRGGRGMGIK